MLSLRNALLEGKTQNSEVVMLGLHSLLKGYLAGSAEGGREAGREGGREGGTPNAPSCGFSTGPASVH